jgi:DNA-binding NarL/FixJ family response regulator
MTSRQARGSRRAVAIVDDHPITGAGIAAQLRRQGFDVAAVVTAVEMLDATGDMVVCDLRLPGRSGPDAIAFLAQRGCRVLATSGVARQEEILDVVAAGARGFVSKAAPVSAFMRAIRDVMNFSYFVSAELAHLILADAELRPLRAGDLGDLERAVLRQFERGDDADEVAASLGLAGDAFTGVLSSIWDRAIARRARFRPSPRERQLMCLVAEGCTHKQAAAQMSIAVITISGYLKSIKEKYLATHPDVPGSISPLTAARRWAEENGTRPIGSKWPGADISS